MPEEIALLPCHTEEKGGQQAESVVYSRKETIANENCQSQQDDKTGDPLPRALKTRVGVGGLASSQPGILKEYHPCTRAEMTLTQRRQQVNNECLFGDLLHK